MKKFAVIGDSTCDLRQDTRKQLGIDYFMMNVVFNDLEIKADLYWKEYSAKELYDNMRNKQRVKTTQVPMEEFVRVFEKHLSEGEDVVYIGDEIIVKVLDIDNQGKIRLSRKAALADIEAKKKNG